MKLTVYTRSCNDTLYGMMRSLIPDDVQCVRCTEYPGFEGAELFLRDVIASCDGWAVILDEDAFVYGWEELLHDVNECIKMGYTHAGISDCGTISHRNFAWTTLNPFFNILDCPRLRNLGALKHIGMPVGATMIEPFDPLYLQMWKVGQPLFLYAEDHADGISTDTGFLLHGWYSREYGTDPAHTERINKLYAEACKLSGKVVS